MKASYVDLHKIYSNAIRKYVLHLWSEHKH